MPDGLDPCFTTKYVRMYEIVARPHPNVYVEVINKFCGTTNFSHLETKVFFER
jgi:hypothetical protein